jgi:chorismate mutase
MIKDKLDLAFIAARLEGFEETIIVKLIDRAQYLVNPVIYENGKSGFSGDSSNSLFGLRLIEQEQMDSRFGRFCAPEERPFTKDLPVHQRIVNVPDTGLKLMEYNKISQSDEILKSYLEMIPEICCEGDDGQYGSSVELDVYTIQSIARRIHYGSLYVAECKFAGDPVGYSKLIKEKNISGITEKLTRKDVEENIVIRIRKKTASLQYMVNRLVRNVIDPEIIAEYYKKYIIPLTKQGQIAYLLDRLNV